MNKQIKICDSRWDKSLIGDGADERIKLLFFFFFQNKNTSRLMYNRGDEWYHTVVNRGGD